MGVWGHCPHKILKFNSTDLFIFFPRFQDKDTSYIRCFSFSVRNLHCILLLHIAHSSKVNCTLDKVNCTLCVITHNFRPWPALLILVLVARNRTSTHHFNDLAPMRETIKKITSWLLSINLHLFVIYLFIYYYYYLSIIFIYYQCGI